ncbi:hypothetical protein [Leptospira mayottensis]|uniref:hypothetical protein n=1 Tax=Leptospira mayottensis TaxID=1137606 RepID=UPI0020B127D8|nr:hypothetical protein [Leptospira mayottensis]
MSKTGIDWVFEFQELARSGHRSQPTARNVESNIRHSISLGKVEQDFEIGIC